MSDNADGMRWRTVPGAAETLVPLPADAGAPALARAHVDRQAAGLPQDLVDDALLVISELVTNALQHGEPEIVLRLQVTSAGLWASVQDAGSARPEPSAHDPDSHAVHGRGLRIVDALSSCWGVELDDAAPGKVVWFELRLEPDVPGRRG